VGERPVRAQTKPGDMLNALPETPPEHGEGMEAIFADFEQKVMPGITHWQHPRFFAYFASNAAARLLEIATRNADELVEDAKDQADKIIGEARTKAERLTNESRGKADRLETDARIRAQKLDEETNERRQQAVAAIERERYELQREVEHLRAYEREYRARLKNYFQSQLDQLAANENTPAAANQGQNDGSPRRLRSLLGDEDSNASL
ncbi:pyridoxal-dependent decarboxylase, partial [Aeromicrobium sp. REDSEA-S32_B7]|uniref:pyridoxal-dependent decarboxylase n=1 Tax=Aeromicrobium sp. REDSEA-S32_B7 TaxID=1811526 RepID=UPI002953104B